jgi:hypothetical protein
VDGGLITHHLLPKFRSLLCPALLRGLLGRFSGEGLWCFEWTEALLLLVSRGNLLGWKFTMTQVLRNHGLGCKRVEHGATWVWKGVTKGDNAL